MEAIRVVDGKAQINPACRGCWRCVEACPNKAIELTIEEDTCVQGAIHRLSQRVDVC